MYTDVASDERRFEKLLAFLVAVFVASKLLETNTAIFSLPATLQYLGCPHNGNATKTKLKQDGFIYQFYFGRPRM